MKALSKLKRTAAGGIMRGRTLVTLKNFCDAVEREEGCRRRNLWHTVTISSQTSFSIDIFPPPPSVGHKANLRLKARL